MTWYPALGWGVFWLGLIAIIVLMSLHKKIYPLFYVSSVCLYIFTAGFLIDDFNFSKLGIMAVLLFSGLLFMGLGLYLSKAFSKQTPAQ